MPRRRALRRNVGPRQIAVARLDRTRELLTLSRIAIENDRAVRPGRELPQETAREPRLSAP